jgi:hypothetical protein
MNFSLARRWLLRVILSVQPFLNRFHHKYSFWDEYIDENWSVPLNFRTPFFMLPRRTKFPGTPQKYGKFLNFTRIPLTPNCGHTCFALDNEVRIPYLDSN